MGIRYLSIQIGDDNRKILVTEEMAADAKSLLLKMDQDMDGGWQLGKYFISAPSCLQRCQIVANRLLTALHTGNQASMTLMAAYILSRLPDVHRVDLNVEGETEETRFYDQNDALI